jgi:hypothetical protein
MMALRWIGKCVKALHGDAHDVKRVPMPADRPKSAIVFETALAAQYQAN